MRIFLKFRNLLGGQWRIALRIPFVEFYGEDVPAVGECDVIVGGKFPLLKQKNWFLLRRDLVAHGAQALQRDTEMVNAALTLHGLKWFFAYSWHNWRPVVKNVLNLHKILAFSKIVGV